VSSRTARAVAVGRGAAVAVVAVGPDTAARAPPSHPSAPLTAPTRCRAADPLGFGVKPPCIDTRGLVPWTCAALNLRRVVSTSILAGRSDRFPFFWIGFVCLGDGARPRVAAVHGAPGARGHHRPGVARGPRRRSLRGVRHPRRPPRPGRRARGGGVCFGPLPLSLLVVPNRMLCPIHPLRNVCRLLKILQF